MFQIERRFLSYTIGESTCHFMFTLLVVGSGSVPLILCHLLREPHPSTFPPKLREFYSNLDKRFDCDFNRLTTCDFVTHPFSWSFHQSLWELAEQFNRAAAIALRNNGSRPNNGTTANLKDGGVDLMNINYFPCAISSHRQDGSGSIDLIPQLSSSMNLSIPWPQFSSFAVPPDAEPGHQHPNELPPPVLQPLSPYNSYPPLACVHVHLRFPTNLSSKVQLSFTSLLQEIDLPLYPLSQAMRHQQLSHIHLDQSLFAHAISADQEFYVQIPRDSWIELTVPVRVYSTDANTTTVQQNMSSMPTLAVFTTTGRTWIAHDIHRLLRLQTSPNVCVDNFRFRVLDHKAQTVAPGNMCLRSLIWNDPLTDMKRMLLIDEYGTPVDFNGDHSMVPLLRIPNRSNNYAYGFGWLQFTGSLILAVSTTIFFLLFVIAVGMSVLFAHQRRVNRSLPKSPLPIRPPAVDGSLDPCSASLLSESNSNKYDPVCPPTNEPETGSIQCSESLFHNSTGTYRSNHENQSEITDFPVDATNTSAVQLMRNWYFYRRRGLRTRQKCGQHREPEVSPISCMLPAAVSARPATHGIPVRAKNNRVSATNHLGRRSLIICTDSNNQLIIMPHTPDQCTPFPHANDPHEAVDSLLDSIPETVSRPFQIGSECECSAKSRHSDRDRCTEHGEWPSTGSLTPSTIARSQLSVNRTNRSS